MTENEIVAAAKTNWLAWQGLKELQPEVAAWMEGHRADCRVMDCEHATLNKREIGFNSEGCVYRLRPDYEQLKWWFDTITKDVRQGSCAVHSACVEVTAEYADYLRNKPDGECELRIPKAGEVYFCMYDKSPETVPYHLTDLGDGDRGYRWCKPKPDITKLRRELVEARARMMDATEAYLAAKHRLDGALRPSK